MSFVMNGNEILLGYRQAKEKRKQVEILADLNACTKREIAQFLVQCGEEVDKRLLREPRKRTEQLPEHTGGAVIVPEPSYDPADSGPDLTGEVDTIFEELEAAAPEVDDSPGMTVETLRGLLAGIEGTAEIQLGDSGEPIRGLGLSATFDAEGNRTRCTVFLYE